MSNEDFVKRVCLTPKISKIKGIYNISVECYSDDHGGNLRLTTYAFSADTLEGCWVGLVKQLSLSTRGGVKINTHNFSNQRD